MKIEFVVKGLCLDNKQTSEKCTQYKKWQLSSQTKIELSKEHSG